MTAAIATAAADGGTLTGFTPAILSGGYYVDGRAPLGGTLSVLDGMSTVIICTIVPFRSIKYLILNVL